MADRQDPGTYSALFVTQGYADLQASFIRMHELLDVGGYPVLSQMLRAAFLRFRTDMERISKEIAAKATQYIKEEEIATRVRPDSGGDRSGLRLNDFVGESAPLGAVPGSVGVNFEPSLYDNVPWWWTNEEGYSGHVGRVVHGFFFGPGYTGASRPDMGRFREHPLFRAEGPQRDSNSFGPDHDRQPSSKGAKGERPGMRIENPIPPRKFVLRGTQRAEAEWHAAFRTAKATFDKEIDRITALIRPKA